MHALILVGGYGTRLRPLTFTTCKPLVPFCNKPMIVHQVEALKAAGVTQIVLAVAYRPELMREEMEVWAKELGVSFFFSHEEEPLGTAGPLALARDQLMKDDKPFFVLNSDVTCQFPLAEMLAFHTNHGGEATILVTQVADPSKYGVVVYEEKTGKINAFVEKPKEFVGDKINAGIYCLNKSVLDRIKLEPTSIEKQVFPVIAADNKLFAMELPGFWMDIGQPHDYISGLKMKLDSLAHDDPPQHTTVDAAKAKGFVVKGKVLNHPTAEISAGAVLGPNVSIGANTKVAAAARLSNTAVFNNCSIGTGAFLDTTIVGWSSHVQGWCHLTANTVLGEDVVVKEGVVLVGTKVLPNKGVGESQFQPTIIM